MDTKIWFLLTLVAIVRSKDLSEGSESFGTNSQKIFDENKKANPAIWRQVDNITITGDEGMKINKILVTDLREEKDGEAKILEGGIDHQNVTIELKSPTALRGYDFHIEVYANSDNTKASSHDASKQETNAKPSDEKKPLKAVPSVPVTLTRDEPTSEQPQEGGKRQNRDVEDKDKTNKQLNPHSTSATTVPELKSTSIPATNKDKREDKLPEHGNTNQPIHLQEAPKMPESTARSIPTTELKIAEEKHNHHEIHDNFENKKQTNFESNDKHADVKYSQFNVREVTPNVPINVQSPAEEGHKRHVRDINQNSPVVKTKEQPLPPATLGNQGSTTTKVANDETNQPENSQSAPTDNKQIKEQVNVAKEEKVHERHNHNNRFNGRYVPDRFARNRNSDSKRDTSTEINKISTTITSQSSTPIIPRLIVNVPTTNKPESSTGKQINSDINTELHTNKRSTSEEITAHKRHTRDTIDKNNKEQPNLSTGNLKYSPISTTLKPEINRKSELNINTSKVSSYGIKVPIEATEKDNENKQDIPKTDNLENKEKQRNIRGTEDKEEKDNKLTTSTTKPGNTENHKNAPSTEKTHIQLPIQFKTTSQDKHPNDAKKERITRDVIGTQNTCHQSNDKKLCAPGMNTENGRKSDEKVTEEKELKGTTVVVASNKNAKSEITPKIGENVTQKNDLSTTVKPSIHRENEKEKPEKSLVPPQ
ncbi:PREDICTED: DNA ligase 1-like [Papilio xuthus]|uniref:DNA ligase 1-like n=1 Tax=Papilio xuthus TaxID=66420 RepID=A0AAJ6Z2N9_PAPXU|nr:PREDICTED: DNA ligase 1-like [Papilio xuthus]